MDIPKEIKTDQQLQFWNTVRQCRERMEQIKDNAAQIIENAPGPLRQVVFHQLHAEMQHLGGIVLQIRSNCSHIARSWREVDDSTVIDCSQCVICQLDLGSVV
jgi:hypothetical protein